MRNKYLLWALLVIAVFLAGFLPPYAKNARLESELREARQRTERFELRDLIGLTYIQAVQKNYGLASQTSTQFFNRVQELAGAVGNMPDRRKAFDEIFSYRDRVTAQLARGDPGVLEVLQSLYLKTRAAGGA